MTMDVEGRDATAFQRRVAAATDLFRADLSRLSGLRIDLHRFEGPHLSPSAGAYQISCGSA